MTYQTQSIEVPTADALALNSGAAIVALKLDSGALMEYKPISRDQWIAELRSGISQTTSYLFRDQAAADEQRSADSEDGEREDQRCYVAGECCLGVGVRLCGAPALSTLKRSMPEHLSFELARRFYLDVGVLDPNDASDARVARIGRVFSSANDELKMTFEDIADALDRTQDIPAADQQAALNAYFNAVHVHRTSLAADVGTNAAYAAYNAAHNVGA